MNQKMHPYFNDFKKVSSKLFDMLGKEKGVAHTDIVKCVSRNFPSDKDPKQKRIIENCKPFLEKQLVEKYPKMIICNGNAVVRLISDIIKPPNLFDQLHARIKTGAKLISEPMTSYIGKLESREIIVILSGFIGRIDNLSKRRLGLEIEQYMSKLEIG